ncbi:hypothetical protein M426DRAFT_8243 [Hypoxylon sp. CI-4A]|nr:hypothetical protein M426DRAFT_8243 [Hypoxylon sp. CI-4A]
MAEAYCACMISYLEGVRANSFPPRPELDTRPTFIALDRRTRWLEARYQITSPPPLPEVSWDSLVWRVCRLARRAPGRLLPKCMPPLQEVSSISFLKSIIASLTIDNHFPWPDKELIAEEELLGSAAQFLCRLAGKRGFKPGLHSFQLDEVCSLAINFSLQAENVPLTSVFRPGPPEHPVFPPGVVGTRKKAKCCDCCSCNCHKKSSRDSDTDSDSDSESDVGKSGGCGLPSFGWLRKLAFWRKKRITDDASSTSSTVVSD